MHWVADGLSVADKIHVEDELVLDESVVVFSYIFYLGHYNVYKACALECFWWIIRKLAIMLNPTTSMLHMELII